MATRDDLTHLTEFEGNDDLAALDDRDPDDRIDFDLYYDGQVVDPWSEGPNELVRLYFNDDRLDGFYVPVTEAERIDEQTRSTPLGRPTRDDDDDESDGDDDAHRTWGDVGGDYHVEQGAEIDGLEWDLLWYRPSEDDEEAVIAAAKFDDAA